jgi:hypothetical protein
MSKPDISKELRLIKESISGLQSKLNDSEIITGCDETESIFTDEDPNITQVNLSQNENSYTNMLIDNKILKLENSIGQQINELDDELSIKIDKVKPNYMLIIFSILIPIILSIIGLFYGIVPIHVKNLFNDNMEIIEKRVGNNFQDYFNNSFDERFKVIENEIGSKKE